MSLFYVYVVGGLLALFSLTLRCVLTTLSHVHVPRFHHAGDSDQEDAEEDEENDEEADLLGPYDSSDNEERERQEQKRRNYELLLRRKRERRPRGQDGDDDGDDDDDLEDMLLQQVEREREDKLCAICQDKEKCIMMLPCKHLCVCQDCHDRWQRHQRAQQAPRKCPICRKVVRQTIKVYL